MNINFGTVTKAFGYNDTPLVKIYGQRNLLLWELKLPTPSRLSEKFLLIEDVEPIDITYKVSYSTTKYHGLKWGTVISPQLIDYTQDYNAILKGIKWLGNTGSGSGNNSSSNIIRTICGIKGFNSAVWQFAQFSGFNGIYLYSPTYNAIVSQVSLFSPNEWVYTDDVDYGFDVSPYLISDPFVDSGFSTETLNVDTDYLVEDWHYKAIFTYERPTVIVYTEEWIDSIYTFFGYNVEDTTVHNIYMVRPDDITHLTPSRVRNRTSFAIYTSDNDSNNSTTDGNYCIIVPYNINGYA